jgi:hypothetical protein
MRKVPGSLPISVAAGSEAITVIVARSSSMMLIVPDVAALSLLRM